MVIFFFNILKHCFKYQIGYNLLKVWRFSLCISINFNSLIISTYLVRYTFISTSWRGAPITDNLKLLLYWLCSSCINFYKDGMFSQSEVLRIATKIHRTWSLALTWRNSEAQLVYQSDKKSTSWLIKWT